ncbi:hypothetical protein DFH11DRAFT_1563476 [Phellopilus nigrolimitatus]|nr:hypothetical protein DFH11DRAFT_1563476 [Phellopilus nigrolimitatus]
MNNLHPQDLPAFLDPLLDYLSSHLPPPLYSAIFSALSHGLVLLSGFISLVATLPSWKPWEWDAQKVLPPIIIALSAYYALFSLFRTTTWMIRMTFRVVKWSIIIGVLSAGLGYFSAPHGGRGDEEGGALDMLRNAIQGQDGTDGAGLGGRTRGRSRNARPRAYDSFQAHQQWQYNEQEAHRAQEEDSMSDAQRVIQYIAGFTGRTLSGAAFDVVAGAKSLLDNIAETATDGSEKEQEGTTGQSGHNSGRAGTRKQYQRRRGTASR